MKRKVLTLTQEQLDAYQKKKGPIERVTADPKAVLLKRRQWILESLGFKSYDEYLKSDLWQGIREQVLRRDMNRCMGRSHNLLLKLSEPDDAGKFTALHVHHYRYDRETLSGIDLSHLITLCAKCHEVRHDPHQRQLITENQRRERDKHQHPNTRRWYSAMTRRR